MKIDVQSGMYYFLTEDEAFKVLLTMGHLSKQKDRTKVRRKHCCTFLEEEMSYGNGMKWGVPTYRNGRYLPTKIGGAYLEKWGVPTYENGGYLRLRMGDTLGVPTYQNGGYLPRKWGVPT